MFPSVIFSDDHVNNLKDSPTKVISEWTIDVENGQWNNDAGSVVTKKCGPQWFGYSGDSAVGTISTKLYTSAHCGKLEFGNCWNVGVVKAYFDDKLIGEAQANTPNKIVEFPILKDGELKIRDEGANSVIKFTKFELVPCTIEPQSKQSYYFWLKTLNF